MAKVLISVDFCRFFLLTIASMSLLNCAGYVPGRQAYWDAEVAELCRRDGGVRIREHLRISKSDLSFLGGEPGRISVPTKSLAHPNAPAYAENTVSQIRKANPAVWRSEWKIVRRSDEATVATWVIYSRTGGDVPGPAHESRFNCPDLSTISTDLQQLFLVEGGVR